jgi:hypothetical protein
MLPVMLRTLVTPVEGSNADTPETFALLALELKRSKWLDPATHDLLFMQYPELGVTRGIHAISRTCVTRGEVITEVITTLCKAKSKGLAYSGTSILNNVSNPRIIGHASAITDLFLDRFHPK